MPVIFSNRKIYTPIVASQTKSERMRNQAQGPENTMLMPVTVSDPFYPPGTLQWGSSYLTWGESLLTFEKTA